MRCERCQQADAQVHIEQTVNAQKVAYNLCHTCFQACRKEGFPVMGSFSSKPSAAQQENNNWLKAFLEPDAAPGMTPQANAPAGICSQCGMTWQAFQQSGRLGCEQCYHTFGAHMPELLHKIHGHMQHVGKTPKPALDDETAPDSVAHLRQALAAAVAEEHYEEAAVLRDRIKMLQQDETGGDDPNVT